MIGKATEGLDEVQAARGMTSNLMKTMAHSPAMLKGVPRF
jgi:hypothetical protein